MKVNHSRRFIAAAMFWILLLSFVFSAAAASDSTQQNKLFSADIYGGRIADPFNFDSDSKGIYLRTSPNVNSKITAFLDNDDNVVLLNSTDDYNYVSANGNSVGYVAKGNLSDKFESFIEGKAPMGTVNKEVALMDPTGIRNANMLNSNYEPASDRLKLSDVRKIGTIKKGASVEWLDYFGSRYFLVKVKGYIGFIPRDAFETTDIDYLIRLGNDLSFLALGDIYEDKDDVFAYFVVANVADKVVKELSLAMYFYDGYGDVIKLKKSDNTIVDFYTYKINDFPKDSAIKDYYLDLSEEYYFMRVLVVSAEFEDGSKWENPYYKAWMNKYKKSYYG